MDSQPGHQAPRQPAEEAPQKASPLSDLGPPAAGEASSPPGALGAGTGWRPLCDQVREGFLVVSRRVLVLWPSAQGGFGSIVAHAAGGEGRKAGGQSPWRGHGPPHSLLPFLWSVPDPLCGLWSQNRVSETTKNLKMAA